MTPVACPKHMVYGPCGGVEADGTCELGDRRSTFLDLPTVAWPSDRVAAPTPTAGAAALRALLGRRAGEDAAVRLAEQLLEAGVDGVDLSGGAGRTGHTAYAETVARIGARIGPR